MLKGSRKGSADASNSKFLLDYHTCELRKQNKYYGALPPLAPSASIAQRIKRMIQKNVIITKKHPSTKFQYRSQAALARECSRHINSKYWYIIHPFSTFRLFWEILIFFVLLTSLLIIPYMLAFSEIEYLRGSHYMDIAYIFITVNEVVLMMDIIVNFNTGIQHYATKKVSLNAREIAADYSRRKLTMDLLTSLPAHIIYLNTEKHDLSYLIAQCVECLMIFRISTLLKYFGNIMELLFQDYSITRIAKIVLQTILNVHWAGCMAYFIPKFFEDIDMEKSDKSWINQYNIKTNNIAVSTWDRYVYSMFQGLAMFTGACTLEPAETVYDMYMCCLIVIWGTAHYMNVFVIILQIMIGIDASQAKYIEVLNQLKQFMRNKHLPVFVQRRLVIYFQYRFQKFYFHEQSIMATLSENLHKEIILQSCRHLVNNVEMFRGLPKIVIGNIIGYLKQEIFLTNDVIARAGSVGTSMYFLSSGTVCIISPLGKEICHLEDGAHFGEIALLIKGSKRVANAVALEICEVYQLEYRDFLRCIVPHSDLLARIQQQAMERVRHTAIADDITIEQLITMEV